MRKSIEFKHLRFRIMDAISPSHRLLIGLVLLFLFSSIILNYDLQHLPLNLIFKNSHSHCFAWESTVNQSSTFYDCRHYSQMSSIVWTYDGTGFMKYLQWIVTRKLANVRITRLNYHCQITYQHFYSTINTIPTSFKSILCLCRLV